MFKPELFSTFKHYDKKMFFQDFIAGIIVGIVALPLSIAFAIASGASPETGIFTAIIAGFCISAFGGTRTQIGGPTGAFTVIIYAIINNPSLGMGALITATLIAGILLILLGVFKMGGLVKFIPYTIVTGFTAGIAITIATGQIGDFFGLNITCFPEGFDKMPGTFVGKIQTYAMNVTHVNWYAFGMAVVCLAVIFLWPKVSKKIPGSFIVIVLATLVNLAVEYFFPNATWAADTIGTKYGSIPTSLPMPQLPDLRLQTIIDVFPTAVSIAVLAAIESLLSAVVADGMTGSKHDSDTELIGQGIANICSPLFGGLPATGAIARTATNIKNGGKTPIAGIVHAITLLIILLFLGNFVVYIPMAALAAVLMSVAWNMAGIPSIKALLKGQKSDSFVLLVTFLITIFVDLTVAIEVGLGFAAFFFIKKMIDLSEVQSSRETLTGGIVKKDLHPDLPKENLDIPENVVIYEVEGPLFFGTVRKFELGIERAEVDCKILILRLRDTIYLDAGGIRALEQAKLACDRKGITILLSGIHTQPFILCEKMGMVEKLGKDNICENINIALDRARELLKNK